VYFSVTLSKRKAVMKLVEKLRREEILSASSEFFNTGVCEKIVAKSARVVIGLRKMKTRSMILRFCSEAF